MPDEDPSAEPNTEQPVEPSAEPAADSTVGQPVDPSAEQQPSPIPVRRLRRAASPNVGGVAEGLASYLGIDPQVVRIAFVVLTVLFAGTGVVLYLACWLLIPAHDDADPRPLAVTPDSTAAVVGFGVLLIGAVLVMNIGFERWFAARSFVPVLLVLAGFWVLNRRQRPQPYGRSPYYPPQPPTWANTAAGPPPPPPWPGAPQAPFPPGAAVPPGHSMPPGHSVPPGTPLPPGYPVPHSYSVPPGQAVPPGRPVGPHPVPPGQPLITPGSTPSEPLLPPEPSRPPPPVQGRSQSWAIADPLPASERSTELSEPTGSPQSVTSITLAAAVVALGFLLVLNNVAGADITATLIVAVVLAVLGGGILASAFTGRSGPLVVLSLFGLALLPSAPLIDTTLIGGMGNRDIEVTSIEALDDAYTVGTGRLALDLSELEVPAGESVKIDVRVGAGYARIIVPPDVALDVRATSRFGRVDAPGGTDGGVGNEINAQAGGADDQGRITIDAEVTFGRAHIIRASPADPTDPAELPESFPDPAELPSSTNPTTPTSTPTTADTASSSGPERPARPGEADEGE